MDHRKKGDQGADHKPDGDRAFSAPGAEAQQGRDPFAPHRLPWSGSANPEWGPVHEDPTPAFGRRGARTCSARSAISVVWRPAGSSGPTLQTDPSETPLGSLCGIFRVPLHQCAIQTEFIVFPVPPTPWRAFLSTRKKDGFRRIGCSLRGMGTFNGKSSESQESIALSGRPVNGKVWRLIW